MEMNQKAFHEQEPRANHPPTINPFETILLSQIYWDFLFVSYSPSFFSNKIFQVDLQMSLLINHLFNTVNLFQKLYNTFYSQIKTEGSNFMYSAVSSADFFGT